RRGPSLFDDNPENPATEPNPDTPAANQGADHAVQDHRSGDAGAADGAFRAASPATQGADNNGESRQGTESQPRRDQEGPAGSQPEERSGSDLLGSVRAGPQGTGGSFTARFAERGSGTFPRRGNGVSQGSFTSRVKASRQQSLFDFDNSDDETPSTP